jgi:hypothetical protein
MPGIRWFAKTIDSNDEDVLAALMDEDVIVAIAAREAVGDEKHLTILTALLTMIVEEDKPSIGGSAPERRKSKQRQRVER